MMGQPRIGGAHRDHQRIDNLALDPVRQMAVVGDVGEAAPAVGDLLVLGERVGDQRELLNALLECRGKRLRSGFALFAVAILQLIERLLDGERLARDFEAQVGDGGVELPVPGRIGRHRLFVKQLLDAVLELIGPIPAHVLEPRPVMAEHPIGHGGVEHRVVDAVELEFEEKQPRPRRGHALLHIAVKLGARRIDGVALVDQRRVGAEPPAEIADRLVAAHRFAERSAAVRRGREGGELALIGLFERDAVGIDAVEVALDRRIGEARVKVSEIPFRQRAEHGLGLGAALSRGTLGGSSGRDLSGSFWHWRGAPHRASCGANLRPPQGTAPPL